MSLTKIVNIKSATPELDEGLVRLYFQNSRYRDYPFSQPALNILKSYLKLIDSIEGHNTFWINKNAKALSTTQLQNLLNKYFEAHDLPAINANELRDLSVQHFSQEGADIRSLQALRQFKQLRRLQSLNEPISVTCKNHLNKNTLGVLFLRKHESIKPSIIIIFIRLN